MSAIMVAMNNRAKVYITIIALIFIGVVASMYNQHQSTGASPQHATSSGSNQAADTKPSSDKKPSFNKKQHSLTDPTSIWVIVNKKTPLNPQDYVPDDLVTPDLPLRVPGNVSMQMRQVTADALTKLFAAAAADGAPMMVSSGYRPYTYQVTLYNGYVKTQGQAVADTQSARPGYSEHQTGLAVDVEPKDQTCDVDECFADTPAGKWVAANAYKYGFVIRYPKGDDAITGYTYEPWHLRYVGVDLATEMHTEGVSTLERFFGLPDAPDYQ